MPDLHMRDLLSDAEGQFEPSPEFVDGLSHELAAVAPAVAVATTKKRRSVAPLVGGAAAAVVLVLGLAMFVGGTVSLEDPTRDQPQVTAAFVPGSAPGELETSQVLAPSIARACESFVVEVGSMLGTETVAFGGSAPVLSAASLYEMRDSLKQVAGLYQYNSSPGSATYETLSVAIREFGQAALYVQLGEHDAAQRHVGEARTVLDEIAAAPGLTGCLEL